MNQRIGTYGTLGDPSPYKIAYDACSAAKQRELDDLVSPQRAEAHRRACVKAAHEAAQARQAEMAEQQAAADAALATIAHAHGKKGHKGKKGKKGHKGRKGGVQAPPSRTPLYILGGLLAVGGGYLIVKRMRAAR